MFAEAKIPHIAGKPTAETRGSQSRRPCRAVASVMLASTGPSSECLNYWMAGQAPAIPRFARTPLIPVQLGIRLTSRFLPEGLQHSMADHFSALKRARQTEKKTATNRANRTRLRSALRSMREAIAKGDKDAAKTALSTAASAVDKGVQKGVLHKNTASRYKARLNARVKGIASK